MITNEGYTAWQKSNDLITTKLQNNMELENTMCFMFYSMTKKIQDFMKKHFTPEKECSMPLHCVQSSPERYDSHSLENYFGSI